jgi:prepilin-type N-terminal cleavage/methylation domain-containing protein
VSLKSGYGFTLAELIVALVASAIVASLATGVLVGQRRVWWEQMWRTDGYATGRAAQMVIAAEMRGALGDSVGGGVSLINSGSTVYRASRYLFFLCKAALRGDSSFSVWAPGLGARSPDPAVDSLLVFREGGDWVPLALRSVGRGQCSDGSASLVLNVSGGVTDSRDNGTPIRGFETSEIRGYRSGSSWWIGMRRVGNDGIWPSIQPAFGPISTRGLEFNAFDSGFTPVLSPGDAAGVELRVGVRHPRRGRVNSWFTTRFRLRNAP